MSTNERRRRRKGARPHKEALSEYLAEIGSRGGHRSRRELTREQSERMNAAKRRRRKGDNEQTT